MSKLATLCFISILLLGVSNLQAVVSPTNLPTSKTTKSLKSFQIRKKKRTLKARIITKIIKRKLQKKLAKPKEDDDKAKMERLTKIGRISILLAAIFTLMAYLVVVVGSVPIGTAVVFLIAADLILLFLIGLNLTRLIHNHKTTKSKKIFWSAILGLVGVFMGFLFILLLIMF